MNYPGRIVKAGDPDATTVKAIEKRLAHLGYQVGAKDGVFDAALRNAVKAFQTRNADRTGRSLIVDGEVGPMTWGALFPSEPLPAAPAGGGGALARRALAKAVSQIGVLEDPARPNHGPMVDEYQLTAGLGGGGNFWCMAFVFWCFHKAAEEMGVTNPFPKTAHCLTAWNRSAGMRITQAQALADPARVTPGAVFIIDYNGSNGHTGFVRSVSDGAMVTVEGNSNPEGSNNGIGVFEVRRRNLANPRMKGFILVP